MEQLSKIEVIDVLNKILFDGLSDAECSMMAAAQPTGSRALFGGDRDIPLSPGVYLAVWSEEDDFENASSLMSYLRNEVSYDTHKIVKDGDFYILIVCLDLFDV